VVIDTIDSQTTPAVAVGHFHADGKGNITEAISTLNQGGILLEQVLTGTYMIDPNGTGEVMIKASNLLPDGTTVPATIETANIDINQPNNEVQLIGTSIIYRLCLNFAHTDIHTGVYPAALDIET
jgi:hypothetical protein